MSVMLSSLTGKTRSAKVAVGDTEVNFTYRPNAITLGMSMSLAEGEEQMVDVLAEVLEDWDVVEVEGEPFPPNVENLRKVPIELATLIARKVTSGEEDDAQGGSGGGSFGSG